MSFKFKTIIFLFLVLFSFKVSAATDPVNWSLNRTFQSPTYSGRSYTVTYTLISQLPATMTKAMTIAKNATPASEFTYDDGCTGLKLTPGQRCNIRVIFQPIGDGNKSIQLIIGGYDSNQTKLPFLTTTSTGHTSIQSAYGNVTAALPGTSTAGQSYPYVFTFTNNSQTTINNIAINVTQTTGTPTYSTTCTSTLGAKKTCTVNGTYTPSSSSPSTQSVTATMNYGQNNSASITTSTIVTVPNQSLIGSFVGFNYLPGVMVGGVANQKTIWALFTNAGSTAVTVSTNNPPITAIVGAGIVTLTPVFNHCSGVVLNPGAACDVQSTFVANTVGAPTNVTVNAAATYTDGIGTTASIDTSTTVVPALGASRTVTLTNNCNFPVWFSLHGGALKNSPVCTYSTSCADGTCGCPTGTTCGINNSCFWTNPAPTSGAGGSTLYELPQNASNNVTIPLTSADSAIQWSGTVSASLGCDGSSSCTQATCQNSGGSTSCTPGVGFSTPATQAEITMNISTSDSYDVEVINGFHIPVQMAPTAPFGTANNYYCSAAGGFTAANGFGSCNWQTAVTPGTNSSNGSGYFWVTSSSTGCNINAPSCTDTTKVCGLDSNMNQVCGSFLGYWTANQICSMNNASSAIRNYFQCDVKLNTLTSSLSFPTNSTLHDLMACAVPTGDVQPTFNSCYLTYSSVPSNNEISCCGCKDWWTIAGINSNPNTQSCTQAGKSSPQTDPVWNQYIQPGVEWLKKACPSGYTYPFDDKTSSFTCTNTIPGSSNSVGYTITFCSGNTGLPAGKTEGRV